jgi:hypothetical protein
LKALRPFSRRPPSSPRGGSGLPRPSPSEGGQSPGGSLARPSRPHLRPGPGEPVRWARPPCGGAPPLGPFRRRLHRPRWGVSLRFTRQAWPQPPGWNHHPKPPAPAGQAYWDGEPTWPGTAVAVAVWWPPTLPLDRERPAGPPGSRRGVPSPRGPFWPSPFLRGSTPRGFRLPSPGRPPSRGGEPEAQALPPRVPRPPGSGISQGKPVRAFLATAQR